MCMYPYTHAGKPQKHVFIAYISGTINANQHLDTASIHEQSRRTTIEEEVESARGNHCLSLGL